MTHAIERGSGLESLLERLEELEKERKALVTKQQTLQAESRIQISAAEISSQVAGFVLNFEREFEKAPIQERKLLIQRCISEIIVDRDNSVARFHVGGSRPSFPRYRPTPIKKGYPQKLWVTGVAGVRTFNYSQPVRRSSCYKWEFSPEGRLLANCHFGDLCC